MKVWVVGSGGTLGKDLVEVLSDAGHDVSATDRKEVDITNEAAVFAYAQALSPNVIINAAAYNAVDLAEDEEGWEKARAINGEAPGILARAATSMDARFVHYSSDYVFSGLKGAPYVENDETDPVSKYGESKAMGESLAMEYCAQSFIIRTSKLFGEQGTSEMTKRSFVDIMLQKAQTGDALTLVDDEVGCPTYTPHLAQKTLEMIEQNVAPGIYHLVNEGEGVTWYAFAKEIFRVAGLHPQVTPVSGDAFPRKAKRPQSVILQNVKMTKLPGRIEALKEYIKKRGQ